MLKGLGNLEDEILISLFGVISSKREDMENKWKNTQKLKKIKTCVLCLIIFNILYNWLVGLKGFTLCIVFFVVHIIQTGIMSKNREECDGQKFY